MIDGDLGDLAYTAGRDGTIRAWDLHTGTPLQLLASQQQQRAEKASQLNAPLMHNNKLSQRAPWLRMLAESSVIVSGFFQYMSFPYVVRSSPDGADDVPKMCF